MTWYEEALQLIKRSGIPVTSSIVDGDALFVEATSSDGDAVTIIVTADGSAVAEQLGFDDDTTGQLYRVQVGAYKKQVYAQAMKETLLDHGFSAYVRHDGDLYRVQVGAYSQLHNAKLMVAKLKAAGFEAIIK